MLLHQGGAQNPPTPPTYPAPANRAYTGHNRELSADSHRRRPRPAHHGLPPHAPAVHLRHRRQAGHQRVLVRAAWSRTSTSTIGHKSRARRVRRDQQQDRHPRRHAGPGRQGDPRSSTTTLSRAAGQHGHRDDHRRHPSARDTPTGQNAAGEQPTGDVIADAQLAARPRRRLRRRRGGVHEPRRRPRELPVRPDQRRRQPAASSPTARRSPSSRSATRRRSSLTGRRSRRAQQQCQQTRRRATEPDHARRRRTSATRGPPRPAGVRRRTPWTRSIGGQAVPNDKPAQLPHDHEQLHRRRRRRLHGVPQLHQRARRRGRPRRVRARTWRPTARTSRLRR